MASPLDPSLLFSQYFLPKSTYLSVWSSPRHTNHDSRLGSPASHHQLPSFSIHHANNSSSCFLRLPTRTADLHPACRSLALIAPTGSSIIDLVLPMGIGIRARHSVLTLTDTSGSYSSLARAQAVTIFWNVSSAGQAVVLEQAVVDRTHSNILLSVLIVKTAIFQSCTADLPRKETLPSALTPYMTDFRECATASRRDWYI